MTIEIKANNIIDTVIPLLHDIENFYSEARREYPKGAIYIDYLPDRLKRLHTEMWAAERKISILSDVLGVHTAVLYEAAKVARRWYNRTSWQRCLNENEAAGIWTLAIRNNGR